MPRRLRLDAELVRRGLARSREHAGELISAKRVKVAGAVATKAATGVTTDVALVVLEDPDRPDYVSRGGHKLAGCLAAFEPLGLSVAGRRCMDAGASTGGRLDHGLRLGGLRTRLVSLDEEVRISESAEDISLHGGDFFTDAIASARALSYAALKIAADAAFSAARAACGQRAS